MSIYGSGRKKQEVDAWGVPVLTGKSRGSHGAIKDRDRRRKEVDPTYETNAERIAREEQERIAASWPEMYKTIFAPPESPAVNKPAETPGYAGLPGYAPLPDYGIKQPDPNANAKFVGGADWSVVPGLEVEHRPAFQQIATRPQGGRDMSGMRDIAAALRSYLDSPQAARQQDLSNYRPFDRPGYKAPGGQGNGTVSTV